MFVPDHEKRTAPAVPGAVRPTMRTPGVPPPAPPLLELDDALLELDALLLELVAPLLPELDDALPELVAPLPLEPLVTPLPLVDDAPVEPGLPREDAVDSP